MKRATLLFLAVVFLFVSGCVSTGIKSNEPVIRILLEADLKDRAGDETLTSVQKTLQARVDKMKFDRVNITVLKPNQLIVLAPADNDIKRLKDALTRSGLLEFRLVESSNYYGPSKQAIMARFDKIPEGYRFYPAAGKRTNNTKVYLLKEKSDLDGSFIKEAQPSLDHMSYPTVAFEFTDEGAVLFGELTEKNIKKMLAIMVDGKVFSAPVIQSKITERGVINGTFTLQEAKELAAILNVGPLPAPVKVVEEKIVQPEAK